jgi:hypothetical protein
MAPSETEQSKPPATAMREALDRIEATLRALAARQDEAQHSLERLVAECRDELTEATTTLVQTVQGLPVEPLQREVQAIRQRLTSPPARGWRPSWLVQAGALVLAGTLGALGMWRIMPGAAQEARLMRAMDGVLATRSSQLPADLLRQVDTLYKEYGFTPLTARKGGK